MLPVKSSSSPSIEIPGHSPLNNNKGYVSPAVITWGCCFTAIAGHGLDIP